MDKNRIYFVIDMKSFFASVECAERGLDPFKTNLVVADPERTKGTICLAVTPRLKELGVKNRCRIYEIPKHIKYIVAKPRMKKYIEYASKIYGIYLDYIDKNDIHVYSIDECFIDATDYLKLYNLSAEDFAKMLMNLIGEKLKIPCSVGIGTNMFLAKVALDITAKKSKNRIGFLDEEKFKQTLWHHTPLTDFWQISTGTAERLSKYNIIDMCGIANFNEDILYKLFGVNAELLIDHAWGRESCTIADVKAYTPQSKSLSSSQILPCNYTSETALTALLEMVQNGCYDLIRQEVKASGIRIFLRYGDNKETGEKCTISFDSPLNLYSQINKKVMVSFHEIADASRPIRKVGFDFFGLIPDTASQLNFFVNLNKNEREKKLIKSIIKLHDKYGKNSVLKGIDLCEKSTIKERNNMIGGHCG